MKKIIIFAAMMIAVSVSAQVNIANGLLAYYPYNGNANDESGNAYNGTVGAGCSLDTDRFGNSNNAYYFSGSYINSGVTHDILTNYTVNMWFEKASSNNSVFFTWYNSDNDGYTEAESNNLGGVFTDWSTSDPNNSCSNNYTALSNGTFSNLQWHMVTISKNNNTISVYVDTMLVSSVNVQDTCNIGSRIVNDFYISTTVGGFQFDGKLDDVMVHNRPLNTAEISYLYKLNSSWSSPTSTEVISENELRLFPNPAQNALNIQLSENSNYALEVTDLNGKRVYNSNLSGQYFELNTAEWAQGLYLLRLIDENGKTYTQKVVKD